MSFPLSPLTLPLPNPPLPVSSTASTSLSRSRLNVNTPPVPPGSEESNNEENHENLLPSQRQYEGGEKVLQKIGATITTPASTPFFLSSSSHNFNTSSSPFSSYPPFPSSALLMAAQSSESEAESAMIVPLCLPLSPVDEKEEDKKKAEQEVIEVVTILDDTKDEEEVVVVDDDEEEEEMDEEERLRQQREKEERESQELIWQMLREEQMELYQLQLQFMQNAESEGLSEEDRRALQEAMRENNSVIQHINQPRPQQPEADEQQAVDDGEDEEEAEDEEGEEEEWDYERLLALGQALGDVKTERWRTRAQVVIASLPQITYRELQNLPSSPAPPLSSSLEEDQPTQKKAKVERLSIYHDHRCVVCMEEFEAADLLRLLPCTHYFHLSCTAGWLAVRQHEISPPPLIILLT